MECIGKFTDKIGALWTDRSHSEKILIYILLGTVTLLAIFILTLALVAKDKDSGNNHAQIFADIYSAGLQSVSIRES